MFFTFLFSGNKTDFSSFGVAYVPEAIGKQVTVTAVGLDGKELGMVDRMKNTLNLHKMDYMLAALNHRYSNAGTGISR